MLSAHGDDTYIEEANNSGAMGYLIKQTCAESAPAAIREILAGKMFYSPSIPKRLRKRSRKAAAD
jgi:DNA-binding NarL/FixJ family response regulator